MRHALMVLSSIIILTTTAAYAGVCGDANFDGAVNIGDAVYVVNYIFKGGPAPICGGSEIGTVTDIDGNLYYTIKICNQWWMLENLKVTHYRNNEEIPNVTDGGIWAGLTTGACCSYNNDENNVATYGRLYNWYAVTDSRIIAPVGWHVPSDAEWQTLIDCLGGYAVAGGKMKETGLVHWNDPNTGATNESGFSALSSGYRHAFGYYDQMGLYAGFWSSSEDSGEAWYRSLFYNDSQGLRGHYTEGTGIAIRCVKD